MTFILSFMIDGDEPTYYGPFKTNDLAVRYGQRKMASLEDDEDGAWESIKVEPPFGETEA